MDKKFILDLFRTLTPYFESIAKFFQKKPSAPQKQIIKPTPVLVEKEVEVVAEPSVDIVEIKSQPTMDKEFIKSIHQLPLNSDEYMQEECAKYQIYLHHTAGNASGRATMRNWDSDKRGRIATCVTISNTGAKDSPDGEIVQGFSSKYWAYHLGLKQDHFKAFNAPYKQLDKYSIGIEICAWGPLTLKDGKFYTYVNTVVPADQVCELEEPFKGHKYYHKYSDAQIESVKNLLLYWNEVYDIPLDYNEDIWGLTERAFTMEPGVYTHNSVRKDKSDVFPQPELIAMLKSLA